MFELSSSVPASPALRPRVVAGSGALAALAGLADRAASVHLVTDENLEGTPWPAKARESLRVPSGVPITSSVLRSGERFKTIEAVASLWRDLAAAGAGRDALVVAVGGGCVTDVAGFAAASWTRGVAWLAVPTTLLGMADAALGGKTGVNTEAGKNLAGAVHHPLAVVADTDCLATLAPVRCREGWAEIVKAGGLGDLGLFEQLERDAQSLAGHEGPAFDAVLARSMQVKLDVVARDPGEDSRREILNWGHTLGHALEAATDHRLSHGEAVAIGLVAETRLGETVVPALAGLSARLEAVLRAFGLPVVPPAGVDRSRLEGALRLDKKRRRAAVRVSLPQAPGIHGERPSREVDVQALLEALG